MHRMKSKGLAQLPKKRGWYINYQISKSMYNRMIWEFAINYNDECYYNLC